MIKNRRGLSGIIVTLITVLLAVVAIGIIWVVISGIIKGNTENIEIAEKCQGALISIESVGRIGDNCPVTLKRSAGGSNEIIEGVAVSVNGANQGDFLGDFISEKSKNIYCLDDPTTAIARVYFTVGGERKYCSPVEWAA